MTSRFTEVGYSRHMVWGQEKIVDALSNQA